MSAVVASTPPETPWVNRATSSVDGIALARELAGGFRTTAVERDRENRAPLAELRRLRESGLVNLLIPRRFGGVGGTIGQAARIVLELSRGDASLAMLYTFHHFYALTPILLRQEPDSHSVLRQSAEQFWLWGNITQYVKQAFIATPHPEGGYLLSGTKNWNTGAPLADRTVVLAQVRGGADYIYAHLPTDRAGVQFHRDWNQLGLRGADSGRVTFQDARVFPHEVVPWPRSENDNGPVPFWNIFRLLCSSAIYLGLSLEALDQAKNYLETQGRKHLLPGSTGPVHDPFIQAEFGELSIQVKAALAYFHQTAGEIESAWERWDELSSAERTAVQVNASATRSFATQVALAVTPKIYNFTGARATGNGFSFDRYWRDAQMLSMHDPLTYSLRGAGAYWLTGEWPKLSTHLDPPPATNGVHPS